MWMMGLEGLRATSKHWLMGRSVHCVRNCVRSIAAPGFSKRSMPFLMQPEYWRIQS